MNISWVFAGTHNLDPTIDVNSIKDIGSTWGSWHTWRSCGTDNVICSSLDKARELIKRNFQNCCNFYTAKKHYDALSRPVNIRLYDGDFDQETHGIEDIIAMHLAAVNNDVILLLGFDLAKPVLPELDRLEKHRILNRHGLIRSAIATNQQTQWVVIDHPAELDKAYQSLANLTCDKMENVIQLLV